MLSLTVLPPLFCSNLPSVEYLIVNLYREADKKKKKDKNTLVGKYIHHLLRKSLSREKMYEISISNIT